MSVSRRRFLESTALAALASRAMAATADAKTGMPMRTLGRTGAKVSLLGFGAGTRWLMYKEEDKALEAMNRAIDNGVNYIDSAASYGDGESERRTGLIMKTRRKEVWLVTKIQDRTYDGYMRTLEASLKRLQTDHVDLLQIHDLRGADVARIEAAGGCLKAAYKVREQKTARFIGVTCHADPEVLKAFIERNDLDCTQMALNAALIGAAEPSNVRGYPKSFETVALPAALKKNMGVTAMKALAQEKLLPDASPRDLVRYAMSLPVAAAVVGMPRLEHLDENIRLAKSFSPMPESEKKSLTGRLAAEKKAAIDAFFFHHVDACDESGRELAV